MTLPAISLTTIDGQSRHLEDYAGQVLLIVNVASECGYTPQYAGLQALFAKYGKQGFVVLAFPCNQFGHQEPGNAEEIAAFCTTRYAVSFPMFEKIEVNGAQAHPLFVHLREAAPGLLGSTAIKWNFTKFLVDRTGKVMQRYGSMITPEALAGDIEALL